MKTYKITFNKQVRAFQSIVIVFIAYLFILFYFINRDGFKIETLWFFTIAFVIISLFPLLFIHVEYYLKNRGVTLKVDDLNNTLEYISDGMTFNIDFSEIEKVEWHQSASFLKKEIQWFPTDRYHYSKIFIKGGSKLTITCLLTTDPTLGLHDKVIEKKRIIASLFFEDVFS